VSGVELYLRLAGATAVVLLPGWLVARALGRGNGSGTLAWALALVFGGLLLVFALSSGLNVAFVVLGAGGLVALPFVRHGRLLPDRAAAGVFCAGTVFGWVLWRFLPAIRGDAYFHLARVRKLLDLDELSPLRVSELAGGGLHPGYAFPLWHGFLALVARVAQVDPALVVQYEAAVLAPIAFLVVYEAGAWLFESRWLGAATLVATLGLTAFASGSGGAFRSLSLPATAGGRQLLVPAALALLFAYLREPTRGGVATLTAGGLALVVVHPTYALFLLLLVVAFLLARVVLARSELAPAAIGFAALAVPAALFVLWLLPTVRETSAHNPSRSALAQARERYKRQVVYDSADRYRLAAGVITRAGTVPVAALSVVPLAFFALRRRWGAFVVGATLACLAVLLIPWLFPVFSDAVSLSQSRRLAGFIPFAFALAGSAAVLARLVSWAVLPIALAAGALLQWRYPGDFGYVLRTGGPVLPVWIAAIGGIAALALGLRYRRTIERAGPVAFAAVALFVLPTALATDWRRPPPAEDELSRGLIAALRRDARPGDVVFSDAETSYRLAAYVPVYLAASAPAHTADTTTNRPRERERVADELFRTGNLSIARRYGAAWLVVDRRRHPRTRVSAKRIYRDARYEVFDLRKR
jgi:hypothetical protein